MPFLGKGCYIVGLNFLGLKVVLGRERGDQRVWPRNWAGEFSVASTYELFKGCYEV